MTVALAGKELTAMATALHGELCRGLAVGIQTGRLAVTQLGSEGMAVVAESEHCALDGIQAVTGATPGNRTMVVHDWGKPAYTFYRLSDGRGVRLVWQVPFDPDYERMRHAIRVGAASAADAARFRDLDRAEVAGILDTEPASLFRMVPVTAAAWVPPTLGPWVTCGWCHEQVLEVRTRFIDGEVVCIPCANGLTG